MTSFQTSVFLVCFLILCATSHANAQDPCACSPSTYEFTFDFGLTCPRPGGDFPPGIAEVTCFITSFSADVDDMIPVSVETISIIEANLDRVPIAQSAIEGDFVSGDSFTYTSVAALGDENQIPQSIQLTITGTNAANSSLVQVWAIKFTNECDVYPVLESGESFGWTEFTALGTPQSEVCSSAENIVVPTIAPTIMPTGKDGTGETPSSDSKEDDDEEPEAVEPTETPVTEAPKGKRTPEPTVATSEPTAKPTRATAEPTIKQTDEPTIKETDEPTVAPTAEPSKATEPVPTAQAKDKDKDKDKDGGKNPTSDNPTIQPTMTPRVPTRAPTIRPSKPPKEADDDEMPSGDLSFSYSLDLDDEDLEEWGRPSKKKKGRESEDDKDVRGRVRMGGRGRRHYYY